MTLRAASRTAAAHRWLLVLLALLMSITPLQVQPAAAATSATDAEHEFVARVNIERAKRGLGALRVRDDLVTVARKHSRRMASANRLHHNPNLSTDVKDWRRLAENVGVGGGVASLHRAFMESQGHRDNILDGRVTEVGIGVEVRNGRMWVTEVFRLPASSSHSSGPTLVQFGDVIASSTHGGAVDRVAKRGLTTGCTDVRFCPTGLVTRAQAASFLARALSIEPSSNPPRFEDVSGVHAANIEALADLGVIRGCSQQRYCPNDPVTREQMASLMARALGLQPQRSPFSDVSATHAGAVGALAAEGITNGCSSKRFCARHPISRAQMASLLDRAF